MAEFHVIAGADEAPAYPAVRKMDLADIYDALRKGFDDFWQKPSHYVFLALIYPVAGLVLAYWTTNNNVLPLLFPLMSGFALVGPIAAIGLCEISRRREAGLDTSWRHALDVRRSPAIYSIVAVALMLAAIFFVWLYVAGSLYNGLLGAGAPPTVGAFMQEIFSTREGWLLIVLGNGIGFLFAVLVLATSVVTFPLLLDRDVGAYAAIHTSVRTLLRNPVPVFAWGVIVALALAVGMLPLFAGLAVILPILGHASWHLYRKAVA